MNYTVKPKELVSYMGHTYGAGDVVPGYAGPVVDKPEPVKPVEVKPKKVVATKTVIVPLDAGTEGV